MKSNFFTGLGLALIITGAMMGDSQKAWPCLTFIAIGSAVLLINAKPQKNEKANV